MNQINKDFNSNKSDMEAIDNFRELIQNIHKLHDAKEGCPWHKSQTHESLMPFMFEESNEFKNALKSKNIDNIADELGDILLQVMLHSEISRINNGFSIKDVITKLNKKILIRHPYIFEKKVKVTLKEANNIWKKRKEREKRKE
tara:strand:- start:955 stop:1386 length:432 start_codon:yes stop_codon:yes gene_type:complete